jgi:hypothetical protein
MESRAAEILPLWLHDAISIIALWRIAGCEKITVNLPMTVFLAKDKQFVVRLF